MERRLLNTRNGARAGAAERRLSLWPSAEQCAATAAHSRVTPTAERHLLNTGNGARAGAAERRQSPLWPSAEQCAAAAAHSRVTPTGTPNVEEAPTHSSKSGFEEDKSC